MTVETPAGSEALTADVPNVGSDGLTHLDEHGLARVGATIEPGMILVGEATPRGASAASNEEKLLRAIFGEAMGELRDTSLRAPPGCMILADLGLAPGMRDV